MSFFRPNIDSLQGYVAGQQPQQGKWIKLNTNENPYPPSPAVMQAIGGITGERLTRYPDPVATAFRQQAASVLGVPPSWILCGNGSDDILTVVTRALVAEGGRLRAPYPSYLLYETLAGIQGAQIATVPYERDWSLSDAFVSDCEKVQLAVLANPNSPSGTILSRARIVELAEKLPCPLLVDEAYADFSDENCIRLVAENERIMVSRSLSKSYALAGMRFGFLVAQESIIERLLCVKDSYNCDTLSIAGATAAIADQAWRSENCKKIVATRSRMTEALGDLGFDIPPSQANFLWCTHPTVPLRPIYERLREERILVRYMEYADWGDGLRISVGSDEQVDACLMMLRMMV
ncbi:MAG: histidinol-phosphate transaminase [Pirellulales bacterium]|jgi:histidinol-phosphate aminotransferase|nr:histidinol-phosphate transaminase [Pirellulales bacterium]